MRRHPPAPVAPAHDRTRARTAASGATEARTQFLRALRSPRPVGRIDGTAYSDPLTTALSRFTGTG
jgi:hypothetical protein